MATASGAKNWYQDVEATAAADEGVDDADLPPHLRTN